MLSAAEILVASSLTLVECDRVLIRAVSTGLLSEAVAAERQRVLAQTADHWVIFGLDAEIMERARRPFPREPIRTLDAIHLATAAAVHSLLPELAVLSLDDRIRISGGQMGLQIVPESGT